MGASTSVTTALQMMDVGERNGADGQGPRHCKQEKSQLHYGKAQQVGCLQGLVSSLLEWDTGIRSQCAAVIDSGAHMEGMGTAKPHWCVVFSGGVDKCQGSCSKGVGTSSPA